MPIPPPWHPQMVLAAAAQHEGGPRPADTSGRCPDRRSGTTWPCPPPCGRRTANPSRCRWRPALSVPCPVATPVERSNRMAATRRAVRDAVRTLCPRRRP
jgi:hypothetical protein